MKDLDSYLNDHLAGSVSALELIEHWAHEHNGKPVGDFFMDIETEVRADRDKLHEVMRALKVEESNVRQAGAWVAEKIGRARMMLAGDEPNGLGLVLTLEGLIMGVLGKKLMWSALAAAKLTSAKGFNFDELQRRAEQQIARMDAERTRAAHRVLANNNA